MSKFKNGERENIPLSKLETSIVNKLPLMVKTSTEASLWTYPLQQWWLLHGNKMPRELLYALCLSLSTNFPC